MQGPRGPFSSLAGLPVRGDADLSSGECFIEIVPERATVPGLPPLLTSPEYTPPWIVGLHQATMPTAPIGAYLLRDALFGGRAYTLWRGGFPDSPALLPEYWRRMIREGTAEGVPDGSLARREVAGPSVHFVGRDYNSHGHWWLDIAPRLFFLYRRFPELRKRLTLLVPRDLSEAHRRILARIYDLPADRFERYDPDTEVLLSPIALVPTMVHRDYWFHPSAAEFYRHVVDAVAGAPRARPGAGHERLYVSRARFTEGRRVSRVMVNAAEVESLMREQGFCVVHPEELAIEEQIATFSRAGVVVGEHGSAMKNTLFCPEGTVVVNLHWLNRTQSAIAACRGHRTIFLQSSPVDSGEDGTARYRIDVGKLKECVRVALG